MHEFGTVGNACYGAFGDAGAPLEAARDRLDRYAARNHSLPEQLQHDASTRAVRCGSDKTAEATAGGLTFAALDLVALVAAHIPDRVQVMQRYYGCHANRSRGAQREAGAVEGDTAPTMSGNTTLSQPTVEAPEVLARRAARLPCADLLCRIYEMAPLNFPARGAATRVIAASSELNLIGRILAHLRTKGHDPRFGP